MKISNSIKIALLLLLATSCTKRQKYECTVTHHTNFGAGVDIGLNRNYTGTYEGMKNFERRNSDSTKTTVCH